MSMDIKTKITKKTHSTGTKASGCCEYSYNLIVKIKRASKKQVENIHKAILGATGE